MAASGSLKRFHQVARCVGTVITTWGPPCRCSTVIQQQLRHKMTQSARFKLPSVPKQKEKWIPREERVTTNKIQKDHSPPKNWDKFLARVPEDDVWIRKYYPRPKFSLSKALEMHREFAVPEMLDNEDGLLFFSAKLDMTAKKKNKYISHFGDVVQLPHIVDDGYHCRLMVLCRTQEEKELALGLGATFAGGTEYAAAIGQGELTLGEDFDVLVTTIDYVKEIAPLRKLLLEKYPDKRNGTVGIDVESITTKFLQGKPFVAEKEWEAVANVKMTLGRLNMPDEQVRENLAACVDVICSHRPHDLGPFIKRGFITCPPSMEKFEIVSEQLMPAKKANTKQPKLEEDIGTPES